MAGGRCDQCGVEEYMPYVCKFCKGRYCAAHRLPENHDCQGLDAFKERIRAEGKVFAPPQESRLTPRVATSARAGASLANFWARVEGKMSYIIMGICLGVYVLEFVVLAAAPDQFSNIFMVTSAFATHPWTLVVSIFAHDPRNLNHILFNMLGLFFFGVTVERLLGTRRYTALFLGAGILAGIAEVVIEGARGHSVSALGASGALMGLMGALVVLAPTMSVLVFFVVPAPLWALVGFYVLIDLLGFITPGDQIAHVAHLAGLAAGAAYGYYLRQKGLRAIVRRRDPPAPRPWQ